MNVLSLFDGISCGMVALKRANIHVDKYYASEIDKYAIKISKHNYPNIIQLGDVRNITEEILDNIMPIDLIMGGSPCQDLSNYKYSGEGVKGLNGSKSNLFYEYIRILKYVKPKYFLLENVASMEDKWKDIISDLLDVKPIMINSSLVCAAERNRLYWTNIPQSLLTDRKIKLSDILEDYPSIEETWSEKKRAFVERKRNHSMYIAINGDKSIPITARGYSAWNTQFIEDENGLRDLTIKEYMRLQTIPEWYQWGGD